MELFSNGLDIKKSSPISPILISVGFHLLFALLILFMPMFGKSKKVFVPVMDISLVDSPGGPKSPGIATDSSVKKEPSKPEKIPEPETKVESKPIKKSSGLDDMSEEEKNRLKNRSEDWKPKPSGVTKKADEYFPMSSQANSQNSGRVSGSLSLDATYFPFMWYLNMLKNRIGEHWMPMIETPVTGSPKRVVIAFRLDRSGRVIESEVEEPSGDAALDRSALRAVQAVGTFPGLPSDYPDETLGVHFGFIYEQ